VIRSAVHAMCALCLVSCGASAELRARYAAETARCVANERAIVDRGGSTYERDAEDLRIERARCDAALAAIGGAP
jgi:hypothetical protein